MVDCDYKFMNIPGWESLRATYLDCIPQWPVHGGKKPGTYAITLLYFDWQRLARAKRLN